MTSKLLLLTVALVVAAHAPATVAAPSASAPSGSATSELAEAERAYQDVDYAGVYDHATRALAAGNGTAEETKRLYVLAGIAAASLGNDADAKRAFLVALGLDPSLKLDRALSPKIRGPYLEAQGFWGTYTERLRLSARVAADRTHLAVRLVDPAHLLSRVEVRVRATGDTEDVTAERPAKVSLGFPLSAGARARGFEYLVRGVDEHGNTLAELGTAEEPLSERGAPRAASHASDERPAERSGPSYLWPTVLAVAGAGAAGAGVVFHLKREDAAREWNGAGCEHAGSRRIDQCGDVNTRVHRDGAIAIAGYATGGVLLTTSLVLFLATPGPTRETAPSPPVAGLDACGIAGTGLTCRGRF